MTAPVRNLYQPAFDAYVRMPVTLRRQPLGEDEATQAREPRLPRQGSGRVLMGADGAPRIEIDGRWQPARVAAGCLLRPDEGDLVLWFVDQDAAWVLHVLERASGSARAPQVSLPAGAVLGAQEDGALSLRAGALNVECQAMTVNADDVSVTARAARLVADSCLSVGRLVESAFGTFKLVGEHFSAFFDRVHSHAREHHRTSQELDLVKAGSLDLRAEQLASVHAANVAVDGEQLVKLRGGQIHMG